MNSPVNMTDKRKPFLVRASRVVLYAIYFLVVVIGGTEAIARLLFVTDGESIYWKKRILFTYDEVLNYSLRGNVSIEAEDNRLYPGVSISTNDYGLRNDRIDPDSRKILVLGDSVAFGFGMNSEDALSGQLQYRLPEGWQVVNAGVPGYNIEQYQLTFARLRNVVLPEATIVLLNANDAEARYVLYQGGMTVTRPPSYPWEAGRVVGEVRPLIDTWILPRLSNIRDIAPAATRQRPSNADAKKYYVEQTTRKVEYWNGDSETAEAALTQATEQLSGFLQVLRRSNQRVFVVRYPWPITLQEDGPEDKRKALWRLAVQSVDGVLYRELDDALQAAGQKENQFIPADEHPNRAGHETIAEELKDMLENWLDSSHR